LKTHKNISPETIKAYLAGTLSHDQTHEFEKAMLDDAVLSDMVEGYELLRDKKVDLTNISASLSDSLQKRIAKKETEIYPLWRRVPVYIRAASVLLFLGVAVYLLLNKNDDETIEKLASIPTSKEEKIADTKPNSPIENPVATKDNIKVEMDKIKAERKEVVIQNSKAKVAFDSVISTADAVVIERKQEKEIEPEIVAKPEPTVAYESTPAPVQQAPKSAAPRTPTRADVMKSEEKVYSRRKATENQSDTEIISGTVLNEDSKEPVPNVSLFSNDKSIGKTDEKGQFKLENSLLGNKIDLIAPNFEDTEIRINKNSEETLFIRPKAELIFIDLKRNKTWKYNPSEHSAQPTISPDDYLEYLQKNLKKPKQATDNQIVGNVTVEFKVNKEGKLSDFKIIKSLGYGCDEEAIRVIKEGPPWMPKINSGEPRRQRVRQEVNF
jgi:TonB family protein